MKIIIVTLYVMGACFAQRPSYAGNRAIGYPQIDIPTTTTTQSALGDRFGGQTSTIAAVSTTTERLPIEANGDRNLIQRLKQLPVENQPFWYLNWKQLEQHRAQPQSYPVHRNYFIDFASAPNQQNNFK